MDGDGTTGSEKPMTLPHATEGPCAECPWTPDAIEAFLGPKAATTHPCDPSNCPVRRRDR